MPALPPRESSSVECACALHPCRTTTGPAHDHVVHHHGANTRARVAPPPTHARHDAQVIATTATDAALFYATEDTTWPMAILMVSLYAAFVAGIFSLSAALPGFAGAGDMQLEDISDQGAAPARSRESGRQYGTMQLPPTALDAPASIQRTDHCFVPAALSSCEPSGCHVGTRPDCEPASDDGSSVAADAGRGHAPLERRCAQQGESAQAALRPRAEASPLLGSKTEGTERNAVGRAVEDAEAGLEAGLATTEVGEGGDRGCWELAFAPPRCLFRLSVPKPEGKRVALWPLTILVCVMYTLLLSYTMVRRWLAGRLHELSACRRMPPHDAALTPR
jgi:uncharacterized membrane protein (DUF485 family)